MLSFCGQDNCIVDSAGRLRLPPDVVTAFRGSDQGALVMYGLPEGAIALYSEGVWKQMRGPMLSAPEQIGSSFSMRGALRLFGAMTCGVVLSNQGRITIPQALLEHANLVKGESALVVGVEIGVEIWNVARFKAELERLNKHEKLKRQRELERELQ